MKKTLLTILVLSIVLLLSVSCELINQPEQDGITRVVVVGLDYSEYDDISFISNVNDANDVASAFESLGQNTNNEVQVSRMIQSSTDTGYQTIYPSKTNLVDVINDIKEVATENDTTIFYFSGLGIAEADTIENGKAVYYEAKSLNFSSNIDYSDNYYFLLGKDDSETNAISGSELLSELNEIKGANVVLADTSNSGSLISSRSTTVNTVDFNCNTEVLLDSFNTLSENQNNNVRVLTSTRRYETSKSTRSIDGVEHGTFSATLLEGLNFNNDTKTVVGTPKAANSNVLTLDNLYSWISENDNDSNQTPKITGDPVDLVLFRF